MFRFMIRELALVVVIVALGLAWWVDRAKLNNEYRLQEAENFSWKNKAKAAREVMEDHGWEVEWDEAEAEFYYDKKKGHKDYHISHHNWGRLFP